MESQVVYFYLSPLPKVLMVMIIYDSGGGGIQGSHWIGVFFL